MIRDIFDLNATSLFLDIDGTLLDIAAKPTEVVVPDRLREDLAALTERMDGALALVSGRTIADIDTLFGDAGLRAAGAHGAEVRLDPRGPVSQAVRPLPDRLRHDLEDLAARTDGLMVEDKGVCLAVHYRQVPTAGEALHAALVRLLESVEEPGLGILPGRLVFEIKHLSHDKGTAVDAFMTRPPFAGRMPLFFGDDVTDRAGFAAAVRHGGHAFAVGRDYPEAAKGFDAPGDVRRWLGELAGRTAAG